jgi:hypothetical protein
VLLQRRVGIDTGFDAIVVVLSVTAGVCAAAAHGHGNGDERGDNEQASMATSLFDPSTAGPVEPAAASESLEQGLHQLARGWAGEAPEVVLLDFRRNLNPRSDRIRRPRFVSHYVSPDTHAVCMSPRQPIS